VKPQTLRAAAADVAPHLAADAVAVSVAAGLSLDAVAAAFGGRRTARVMPTTGVAIARGVAAIHAPDAEARARAHALFDPVAVTAELPDEAMMAAAGAVVGSGPAYVYAFVEALERAGEGAGLPPEAARALARATAVTAAALLDASGAEPATLRAQVASPGGITEAALKVLAGDRGLEPLLAAALAANMARGRELAAGG
jgi:pyrroline-5-carboxylate reductase